MSGRRVITLLIGAQVITLAIALWQARELHRDHAISSAASIRSQKQSISTSTAQNRSADGEIPAGVPNERAKTNAPIHSSPANKISQWQRVESEDYRTYVKNLRAIGCPEQTVRDIVSADVIQAFGSRRAGALSARYKDFQFWKVDSADAEAGSELDRQRETIDEEMQLTLRELLGANYVPPPVSYEWRVADLDQRLSFLPEDKRQPTRDLLQQYGEVDQQVKALAGNDTVSSSADYRMKIIDQYEQKRTALKQLLDADQFQQVELAASWTAENLRRALVHFQPTREEFITLFNQWQPYDESLARLHAEGGNDPGNLQDPLYANIRKLMPPERYQQYVDTWWK
jgi:hypothetical protein